MSDWPHIQRLGSARLETMRTLNLMFGEAFDEPQTYAEAPPSDAYLADRLAQPHIIVLAAMDGDAVIGGLVAYELHKLESERSEIYIYDLAVAQSYRRRGVATALIRELRAIARAGRAWVLFVQADYVDPPAIALYEKLGRREEVLHFDIGVHEK